MRQWLALSGFTQRSQSSQKLSPRVVALREHRRVFLPTIMVKNQECSFVVILLLLYLISGFRMCRRYCLSVAGFELERNGSSYPFLGTGNADPCDLLGRSQLG